MDVREKLVELLFKCTSKNINTEFCGGKISFIISQGNIADYLIAHGVTVQEWISVKDRLPTEEDAIDGGFVIANTEEKVVIALWSDVCRFNEFVTHWMPLPQPPKGE